MWASSATENTNLVLPVDLNGLLVNQYSNGAYFGVAAADKSLGSAGVIPADVGSMNSGGWATIAIALKALSTGPTPTATATVATPTATATVIPTVAPTVTPPPPTATATATATSTQLPTATPTPGAITLVGTTSTTTARTVVPTGVQVGDLLLAFYSYWSFNTVTAPTGWQMLQSATSSGSGVEAVWYRFAGSSDVPGTAYNWSFSGSTAYEAGGMLAYRSVDPSAPQDGFCTNSGHSTAPSLCSFTTNFSSDMYVGFFATENTNLVLPADLTGLVVNQYLSGSYFGVAAANKSLGSAGTVSADVGSMNSGGWQPLRLRSKRSTPRLPINRRHRTGHQSTQRSRRSGRSASRQVQNTQKKSRQDRLKTESSQRCSRYHQSHRAGVLQISELGFAPLIECDQKQAKADQKAAVAAINPTSSETEARIRLTYGSSGKMPSRAASALAKIPKKIA